MHRGGVAALAKGWAIGGALRLVPAHPGGLWMHASGVRSCYLRYSLLKLSYGSSVAY